jgi:hypothetical protein
MDFMFSRKNSSTRAAALSRPKCARSWQYYCFLISSNRPASLLDNSAAGLTHFWLLGGDRFLLRRSNEDAGNQG